MKSITFTTEEKARMFDEIAEKFYNRNFGSLSKADMDLMMFRFYFEALMGDNTYQNGNINFHTCSDYNMSRELGISQQRVRNLKVKYQLTSPTDFAWEAALSKLTEKAKYDKDSQKITLNIPDPNLYIEIQNFIEEKGAYVEKQLNSKILQLRTDDYITLILATEDDANKKRIIKSIKEQNKANEKDNSVLDEHNIGKWLLRHSQDAISVVSNLCSLVSSSNLLAPALLMLIQK